MHVSARMGLSLIGAVVLLMLALVLIAGARDMAAAMREQHCNGFSRTAAQIEAAEGNQHQAADGKLEHACIHEDERAVQLGGGA